MTNNEALNRLPHLTWDQLAVLYTIFNRRTIQAAPASRSAAIWMNRRERVVGEIDRRGVVIRRLFDGTYAVGPAAHFEPIEVAR